MIFPLNLHVFHHLLLPEGIIWLGHTRNPSANGSQARLLYYTATWGNIQPDILQHLPLRRAYNPITQSSAAVCRKIFSSLRHFRATVDLSHSRQPRFDLQHWADLWCFLSWDTSKTMTQTVLPDWPLRNLRCSISFPLRIVIFPASHVRLPSNKSSHSGSKIIP